PDDAERIHSRVGPLLAEADPVGTPAPGAGVAANIETDSGILAGGAVAAIDADAGANPAEGGGHVAVDNGALESTDGISRLGQDAVALRVLDHVAVKLDGEAWIIGDREVLIDPDSDARLPIYGAVRVYAVIVHRSARGRLAECAEGNRHALR